MNDAPAMALRPDSWLSEMIGKPAWHLTPTGRELDRVPLPGDAPCFVDAKVPANDVETAQRLEDAGFRLVDTNLQLERPGWPVGHSRTGRFAVPEDRAAVERLAESSFAYSRFHLDPMITRSTADKLKRAWAGNFFEGRRGDHMVVSEVDGEIAGFLQLLRQGEVLVIDLVAVDSRFRGRGLSSDMLAFAESAIHGVARIKVGTQAANARALHAYSRDKFRIISATYVFHYHG